MRKFITVLLSFALSALGQSVTLKKAAVQKYLSGYSQEFAALNSMDAGTRPADGSAVSLLKLLPTRRPFAFPEYVRTTRASSALAFLAGQLADSQMNKMLTGSKGNSGSTSLLSNGTVADILSFATEYGAITQSTSGNTLTARANLLGLAGLLATNPYIGCPSLADGCSATDRALRGFSGSLSIDTPGGSSTSTVSGTNGATGAPASANILSGGYRMSAWGVRYDWFHKSLYDPTQMIAGFATTWKEKMAQISASNTEKQLDDSITSLMSDLDNDATWRQPFLTALEAAPKGGLEDVLQQQLDKTIDAMANRDPNLMSKVQLAANAVLASFAQRDGVLKALQSDKFSTEFNDRHPLGQPNMSNVRLIFSHQPGKAPLLLTANFAVEWYDAIPTGLKQSRLRDLQAAVQVDRKLGNIPNLGQATLTLAYYYQWMKDNALITIPAGNNAPGTGIVLPGAASTLLATKGNIDIFQAKVTMPIKGGIVKVPVSFTWSNRTELINESEKRGQIGLTLDLDSIFQMKP